ncbi:MAG: hypothetical protein ABJC12_01110 [Saprospiraceae bacterium]
MSKNNKYFSFKNTQFWVGFLISIYIIIDLVPPGFVPHSEHDHLGAGNVALEKDPCHISIYHPGESGGCNHKYHISKQPGDCPRCHIILVRQLIVSSNPQIELASFVFRPETQCPEGSIINFPILHDDRGPPVSFIM